MTKNTFNLSAKIGEPLTTLHGNLDFLQDETTSLKQNERFKEILDDVKKITEIYREIQQAEGDNYCQ